jgi:hypothetical protein
MSGLHLAQGFSRNLPTVENSVAIFDNRVSALPIPGAQGGGSQLFVGDPRPSYVHDVFGSLEQFEFWNWALSREDTAISSKNSALIPSPRLRLMQNLL